ncbi:MULTISPECIES: HAD family hydrolase [Pseudoxanthomonas]|uniref:KdsC family phosphatase n=1 Tax=Pseudoxanthomonas TaxID=83618 RepID=UPI001612B9A5|nr:MULTISPECIES: HAD family hydrolase [Pseudoxanthomonas]MBB3277713.1 3-deoxy-D-manno-octulosonate 8-phosphate phosphatase (KDO 8-P phosphatase) [Pseudoxanthomonas sp. OG2]MBD9376041.1 HAD family hydrolase [Pseudoxanthomonas sp. PXM04]MBV7474385.1 HAD family hydrolase [Pseudoxanthomonas sp. PXM05]UBB26056.1 HAD family hydrolase [Pseudoxanthomonas japonensis]
MPLSHLADVDDALIARARQVRLACFDVDGTLTDGRLVYDDEGRESKAFHIHDGQGLVLLRRAGIEVALITARHSPAAERRARELGVRIHAGVKDKLAQVDALCAELGLERVQVAFMGDDLPDLPPLRAVGLAIAPADAHAWTARHAHWRTRARAGRGAAREACDLLLGAQGQAAGLREGIA